MNEILSAIISPCLWNEPCLLYDILFQLRTLFEVEDAYLGEFMKYVSLALDEATKTGLIEKKRGFFLLTAEGRKKMKINKQSFSKNIVSSITAFVGKN